MRKSRKLSVTVPAVQLLESRQMLSVVMEDNNLMVRGTEGDDVIAVNMSEGKGLSVDVTVNGKTVYAKNPWYVGVDAGGGRDTITINANVGEWANMVFIDEWGNDRKFYLYVNGGAGNDDIVSKIDTQHASVDGGYGNDRIRIVGVDGAAYYVNGGAGNDTLLGSLFCDNLYGGDGADSISAAGGDDYIDGGAGNDNLDGGAGSDSIFGRSGNDWIAGLYGDDYIFGGAGDDRIYGGPGDDMLNGDAGNDLIRGGLDNDRIGDLSGRDSLFGDDGDDTFYLIGEWDSSGDHVNGGAGKDCLWTTEDRDLDLVDSLKGVERVYYDYYGGGKG